MTQITITSTTPTYDEAGRLTQLSVRVTAAVSANVSANAIEATFQFSKEPNEPKFLSGGGYGCTVIQPEDFDYQQHADCLREIASKISRDQEVGRFFTQGMTTYRQVLISDNRALYIAAKDNGRVPTSPRFYKTRSGHFYELPNPSDPEAGQPPTRPSSPRPQS